ncbi:MAG: hypothetical protein FWF49_05470, partial [Oscillospiraceae bacterium]|nr:hypothetical protein [Oscillospiraceae bacterium]
MDEQNRGGQSRPPAHILKDNFRPLRVAVACNLKRDRASDAEAEFDEPETVDAIRAALEAGGCETVLLDAAADFPRDLL